MILINGILLGLMLGILAGPLLFSMVQLGIEKGFAAGTSFAAGQWISDFIVIGLVFASSSFLDFIPRYAFWLGVFGALFLFSIGTIMLFTKAPDPDFNQKVSKANLGSYFMQGFLMNTLNPFPFFFWITLMSNSILNNYTIANIYLLFAMVMSTIIIFDLVKVYLAKRIGTLLKPAFLVKLRRFAGFALIVFGIILLVRVSLL